MVQVASMLDLTDGIIHHRVAAVCQVLCWLLLPKARVPFPPQGREIGCLAIGKLANALTVGIDKSYMVPRGLRVPNGFRAPCSGCVPARRGEDYGGQ